MPDWVVRACWHDKQVGVGGVVHGWPEQRGDRAAGEQKGRQDGRSCVDQPTSLYMYSYSRTHSPGRCDRACWNDAGPVMGVMGPLPPIICPLTSVRFSPDTLSSPLAPSAATQKKGGSFFRPR